MAWISNPSLSVFAHGCIFMSNPIDVTGRDAGVKIETLAGGLNYMYKFEADDDKWIITSTDEKQGEILQDYYDINGLILPFM